MPIIESDYHNRLIIVVMVLLQFVSDKEKSNTLKRNIFKSQYMN